MRRLQTPLFPLIVAAGLIATAGVALLIGVSNAASPAAQRRSSLVWGPAAATAVPAPEPIRALAGGASAAAVWTPRPDAASGTLHWLDGAGIPSVATSSLATALTHPFAVIDGRLDAQGAARVSRYAEAGGVVVLDASAVPLLQAEAGLTSAAPQRRTQLAILPGAGVPAATLRFAPLATLGLQGGAGSLAVFPGGAKALTLQRRGAGWVVASGIPLDAAIASAEAGAPGALPTDDGRSALAQLGRVLWGLATPGPGIALGPAPAGAAAAVVLVHELDAPASWAGALPLARIEHDRGVSATWLVRAPTGGLSAAERQELQTIVDLGGRIGTTGTVDVATAALEQGSGSERVPGYAPDGASGATQLGEARIAQQILTTSVRGARVVAFRAPQGPASTALDGVLEGTGFAVDLSGSTTDAGGGLPFRPLAAPAAAGAAPLEQAVIRLPLAVDDDPAGRVDRELPHILALVKRAEATGAPVAVRISPATASVAAFAEQTLLAQLPSDVWVGSADDLAAAWAARARLTIDSAPSVSGWAVRLHADGQVPSLTLLLPTRAASAVLADGTPLVLSSDGLRVAVPPFAGDQIVRIAPAG